MSDTKQNESGAGESPASAKGSAVAAVPNGSGNGNGQAHIQTEQLELAAEAPHHAMPPHAPEGALHKRMDFSFLQYASYVIRDRAIPHLADGLKPVQRRILWAIKTMDDGRFMKVANVVGETMKYHPHGDASIGDALVVLTNKRYLIEGQGNFGNIYTGDPAAAPMGSFGSHNPHKLAWAVERDERLLAHIVWQVLDGIVRDGCRAGRP